MVTSAHLLRDIVVDALPARRGRGEWGANLVEYTLLMAFIALVCVAAVAALGQKVPGGFSSMSGAI